MLSLSRGLRIAPAFRCSAELLVPSPTAHARHMAANGASIRRPGTRWTRPRSRPRRRRTGNSLSLPRNFDVDVQVTAQIQRVTFHNPENGYSVVRAAVDGEPNDITLCGTLHGAREGQAFQLTGRWEQHAHYGEQLAVSECKPISIEQLASANAGLALFLAKTVRGVGHKTAAKIVDYFGESTLDVLTTQSHRLVEVKGVSPRIAKLVATAWGGHAAEQERRAALLGLGVPYHYLERVLDRWAAAAPAIVARDPYRLAFEAGLSFAVADGVAAANLAVSNGVEHHLHSVERYAAATVHALRESTSKGNCCLPTSKLREATANILAAPALQDRRVSVDNVRDEVLTQAWEEMCERGLLVTECFQVLEPQPEPEVMWYMSSVHAAELEVAQSLASRLGWQGESSTNDNHLVEGIHVEQDAGQDVEALAKMELRDVEGRRLLLSDEQLAGVAAAVSHRGRGAIITGGPGCGKTFIMKTVVQIMRDRGWTVALAAPTGRAAQRLSELVGAFGDDLDNHAVDTPHRQSEATTIHRLLEYKPPGGFTRNASNPINADAVVVDEASMLDISLARELCAALDPKTYLVLIGDPDQLPSIGAGNVLSDAIHSRVLATRKLTTVFRQAAASSIISSAYAVNQGDFPMAAQMHAVSVDEFVSTCRAAAAAGAVNEGGDAGRAMRRAQLARLTGAKDCVFVDAGGSIDAAAAAVESALVTLAPAMGFSPTEDVQVLTPGNKGLLGAKELNERLRPLLNPRYAETPSLLHISLPILREYPALELTPTAGQSLPWGVGDKVIQVVNNYDLDVFNGDIGRVTALSEHLDGTLQPTATVEFQTGARSARKVQYTGTSELRQLLPAWAITVHKSQGSEYEVVILPVTMQHWFTLSRNLLYTALTRSQALCIIVGDRRAVHAALARIEGDNRFTGLRQQLQQRCQNFSDTVRTLPEHNGILKTK